jgi:preprotein translocase subunit SecF
MQINSKLRTIDFMGKRRFTAILSVVLLAISIGSLMTRGLNFGIDFTGGVLIEVGYPEPADLVAIRGEVEAGGFGNAIVQNFGSATEVMIRVMPEEGSEAGKLGEQIFSLLRSANSGADLRRVEFVGPQVGEELTESGGLAMLFAICMILIYIWVRFQWKLAVGSVVALVHDVIITMGFFSVLQISFDLAVLAAILAVIGYSLNDTVVVFDRIRENFGLIRKEGAESIMNISVNQMLGRTLITSLTTLLVVGSLFFLGGEAVRGFSVALIVGILIGTYSSIYTASASALALDITSDELLPPKMDKEVLDDMP